VRAASAWAALGLFKPQLFFVFPLIFLVSRRWTVLSGYVAVAVVLSGLPGHRGPRRRAGMDSYPGRARNRQRDRQRLADGITEVILRPAPAWSNLAFSTPYAPCALCLLFMLSCAWSKAKSSLPLLWAGTSFVAVLDNPHLVDYDLTVLVPVGVLASAMVPRLGWPMVLAYIVTLVRAQIPVGAASLQLAVPLLAFSLFWSIRS
jgi:hypothetical protein